MCLKHVKIELDCNFDLNEDNVVKVKLLVMNDLISHRCPICSSEYRRCSDLNRHMKSKHNVSRKDFLEYNSGDNDEETIEMDDDDFDDEIDVQEVTESEESDESQPLSELRLKGKPLAKRINKKCSYCSYIAKWPSDLRRHLRVHSMVKRFKCSLCWKKYKYLGDLNVHMRRDHEVTHPFCPFCFVGEGMRTLSPKHSLIISFEAEKKIAEQN